MATLYRWDGQHRNDDDEKGQRERNVVNDGQIATERDCLKQRWQNSCLIPEG